jgi:acetolactate synthase regulatory subunit
VTAPARFKQCDLERVLKAARRCGFGDVRVRIDAAGNIEAIVGSAANDAPPAVELD